ncbi:MAG: [protein-PII] uridylyltransferase [Bacteroidota bacterium]
MPITWCFPRIRCRLRSHSLYCDVDRDVTPRNNFQNQLRAVAHLHRKGSGGIRTALALTRAMDSAISATFRSFAHPAKSSVAIVCLGGFGRKELCFASDTDIMFLIPQTNAPEMGFAVQKLLHRLLDIGLDIGHSVRTVEDCLALRETDVESWVSLLESRFLCGDKALFSRLRLGLQAQIDKGDRAGLVRELVARMELRHQKYGQSTKLLEPNIKNSAGGLRDLHTVLWLGLGSGAVKLFGGLKPGVTAFTRLLTVPFIRRHVPAGQIRELGKAFDQLLRSRNAMHLESKGLHDSLEFAFQRQVADALKFKSTPNRSSVERFMQEYYVASRRVFLFSRRIAGVLQRQFITPHPQETTLLDKSFMIKGGRVAPRSRTAITNTAVLQALLHSARHRAPFSEDLEDIIAKQYRHCTKLSAKNEAILFREFLNLPEGVGRGLHALSELGIFERWLPEWKPMVAFFQHNQYHYYTADEHTLRVVAIAETLADESTSLGEVFRGLRRRDVLYLACLLHDIAKPERVGDHEITGAAVADRVLRRLRYHDIVEDVSFLVRNHLLMEHVAFRRNLSDPQTIIDFCSRIPRPDLLDYLYVLTYADLSAVNKTVWTDWKGMLLFELYRKSKEVLNKSLSEQQIRQAAGARHAKAVQELVQTLAGVLPEESSSGHLQAVDNAAYLAAFNTEEIAEHIRRIERNEPVAALFIHQDSMTEVTIIARDRRFALSRFCGVLSANDANILDAHIFTRNDGVIIDKFRVTDFLQHKGLSESQCAKIRQELSDVIAGSTDIEHLLERHRMKWKRLAKPVNPNARIGVEFEDHPVYSIIDVFAPDRLGFLYKITETMSRLDLDIASAKIATRADGIVDSFYVRDRDGRKIESGDRRETVRKALLQTITETIESELTPVTA